MMAMSMPTPTQTRPVDPTAHLQGDEAVAYAKTLPLAHRFTLGAEITEVQRSFLDRHGYAVFGGVVKPAEIRRLDEEVRGIQERWLAENRKSVYGIPLFVGKDENGAPFIQRFAFTSVYSDYIRDLVRDRRFEPVRTLIGADARVGDEEKDGVVFNRNLNVPGSAYPRLGWHTDGLRDLAYGRLPGPMLNVGIHLDRVKREDGGLRIIPGTHKQGFWKMCFHKPYFVSHGADVREVAVETEPGDLTVHDGRTWHRVEQSPHVGPRSLRRTMYVPYLTQPYEPKREDSPTPFYHHLGRFLRYLKSFRG